MCARVFMKTGAGMQSPWQKVEYLFAFPSLLSRGHIKFMLPAHIFSKLPYDVSPFLNATFSLVVKEESSILELLPVAQPSSRVLCFLSEFIFPRLVRCIFFVSP